MHPSTDLPIIVIVFGLPGSGKSYFARLLAERMNMAYINSDLLRKKKFSRRTYSENEKLQIYSEMLEEMKRAVKQHKSLVLDATFYKNNIRQSFVREAGSARVLFMEVRAEESTIKERLKETRTDSEADLKVYTIIKKEWEPLPEEHLILHSTNGNIEELLDRAMDYIRVINDKRTDR
jgi:predicted kinase